MSDIGPRASLASPNIFIMPSDPQPLGNDWFYSGIWEVPRALHISSIHFFEIVEDPQVF